MDAHELKGKYVNTKKDMEFEVHFLESDKKEIVKLKAGEIYAIYAVFKSEHEKLPKTILISSKDGKMQYAIPFDENFFEIKK